MTEQSAPLAEVILSAANCLSTEAGTGGVFLRTFVSESCGATGFSTGTATFDSRASLPYHVHPFSEAVTVLEGQAQVFVEGPQVSTESQGLCPFPRRGGTPGDKRRGRFTVGGPLGVRDVGAYAGLSGSGVRRS